MKKSILFALCMFISLLFFSVKVDAEEYETLDPDTGEVVYFWVEDGDVPAAQASLDDLKSFNIQSMQTQIIPTTPIISGENLVYHGEVLYRIKFQFTAMKVSGQPAVNCKIDRIPEWYYRH